MQTYLNAPPANWEHELTKLTPAARAYVERLQQDSQQLRQTFDFGFWRPAELNAVIGKSITHYLSTEWVRHHTDAERYVDSILILHQGLTDAVVYLEGKEKR